MNDGAEICECQEAFLVPSSPEIWIDCIYPFIFWDLVQLENGCGLRSLQSLTLRSPLLPPSLPSPSPSPHHLAVVMLSWQLKCFLSACWVNWLSQKCFLHFALLLANVHTHSRLIFHTLVRTLPDAVQHLTHNSTLNYINNPIHFPTLNWNLTRNPKTPTPLF